MRPLFRFSRPQGPGFGIAREYYLSVLASASVLPSLLQVLNPSGKDGAVTGLGVPLAANTTKESLSEPLRRGAYGLATKDRKTVIRMLVMGKDEAGYDPEVFARNPIASTCSPELVARLRGTWNLIQLTFESHDAEVYPALDFLLSLAARLSLLSEGVVADSVSERYLLPNEVLAPLRLDPRVDAREHVATGFFAAPDGLHVFTRGLRKFALPEFEIAGLLPGDEALATQFLLTLSQSVLLGDLAQPGEKVGSGRAPFQVAEGGFDVGRWDGIPVLELLPPSALAATEALREWQKDLG